MKNTSGKSITSGQFEDNRVNACEQRGEDTSNLLLYRKQHYKSQNGIFMFLITVDMHIFIILFILISQFCEQTNMVIPIYTVGL